MRQILTKKFWSHGTTLGYLGSLNPKTLDRMFSNLVFLVLWGAFEAPVKVATLFRTKRLKTFPSRCDYECNSGNSKHISKDLIG